MSPLHAQCCRTEAFDLALSEANAVDGIGQTDINAISGAKDEHVAGNLPEGRHLTVPLAVMIENCFFHEFVSGRFIRPLDALRYGNEPESGDTKHRGGKNREWDGSFDLASEMWLESDVIGDLVSFSSCLSLIPVLLHRRYQSLGDHGGIDFERGGEILPDR